MEKEPKYKWNLGVVLWPFTVDIRVRAGLMCAVLILAVVHLASWLITCGLVSLVMHAFGMQFRWTAGTAVWIVWYVVKIILNRYGKLK